MSAYDLYGFGGFDRDVYDDRHMLLCDGRDCRTCDRADTKWDRMTTAELAVTHGLEAGE